MIRSLWRRVLAGLLVLVPAWATFLILSALFRTLDELLDTLVGGRLQTYVPGLGLFLLVVLVLTAGFVVTHFIGQRLIDQFEQGVERIPFVRSVYLTLKGMTDLLQFRSRFGRSTVVAFPFPRNGLWALGFVMGGAPAALQVLPLGRLVMVFVPTAIHPLTGYLAFVPEDQVRPLNLSPEDAMKMEFSAGFYRPKSGWLNAP